MREVVIRTSTRIEARDMTTEVRKAVEGEKGKVVHVFTPHTTCGLLLNENADPDVMRDIMESLTRLAPADGRYRHAEGNSDAHLKSSLTGHSLMIPFDDGKIVLGTWQGIYLMEFDGPRQRTVFVTVLS